MVPVCGVRELGEKEQVAKDGSPEQARVVAESNPLRLASVTVMAADAPAEIVAVAGEVTMLKSAAAGGGVALAVRVAKRPCCASTRPAVK